MLLLLVAVAGASFVAGGSVVGASTKAAAGLPEVHSPSLPPGSLQCCVPQHFHCLPPTELGLSPSQFR